MYNIVLQIQYAGIFMVISCILFVFTRRRSREKELLLVVLFAILLNGLGYALELMSTTQDAAIAAIKISYVGKLVAELGVFFFVLEYCDVLLHRAVKYALAFVHFLVEVLIWTCESNTLYYSSIDYTQEGLYPHVILGHGIVYELFTYLTFAYMIVMMALCIYKISRANSAGEIKKTLCVLVAPLSFVVSLIIYKTGITRGYDCTALAYVISSIVFAVALEKFGLIDKVEMAKNTILDEMGEAVVAVDPKDNVIYVNHRFEELHPDYSEKTKKIIYKKIKDEFEANRDLSIDENFYHIIAKELLQDGEKQGTIFVMHDVTEAHRHMELINSYNEQLEKEVVNKTVHIREIQDKMILGMADMVENRDFSTGGHIKRTSDVIKCLVDEMRKDNTLNLSDKFYECLIKAAPMHDLGKIAVDDDILRKPGRFTEEEYDEMKTHAEKGARIVRQLLEGVEDPYFAQIAENVAHYHHERFDGNGYPEGLKGDKIPLEARIMTIADVYDALVSKRCYKESMPYDKAAAIIEEGMGSQFDKSLFAYFQGCRAKLEAYYEGIKES